MNPRCGGGRTETAECAEGGAEVAEGPPGWGEGVNGNAVTGMVLGAAMSVHSALGPGLLESAYETCLYQELDSRGLVVERQVSLPIVYRDVTVHDAYRLDLLVQDLIIVEVKSVGSFTDVHRAQLLSYLRLSGKPIGLLLNFNVAHLRDGIIRMVNAWKE